VSKTWHVLYYETPTEHCPVQTFIDGIKARDQAKILSWIHLLEVHGPTLPRPYADYLEDGIHELRIRLSGHRVRILYFFVFKRYIILSHAFAKTVSRVPAAEIQKAAGHRTEFMRWHNEKRILEVLHEKL
jgi:hypothetical protein